MAEEEDRKKGERRDQTQELTLNELDPFDPPTGEIALDELEEIPQPPPAPGVGKPRKPPRPPRENTLRGHEAPNPEDDAVPRVIGADDGETEETESPESPPAPRTVPPPTPEADDEGEEKEEEAGRAEDEEDDGEKEPRSAPTLPRPKKLAPSPRRRSSPPKPLRPLPRKRAARDDTPKPDEPKKQPSIPPPQPVRPLAAVRTQVVGAPTPEPAPSPEPTATPEPPSTPDAGDDAATAEMPTLAPTSDEAREADLALRQLCERELEETKDADRKAQLHYELGRLLEIRLDDDAEAAHHYQAALRVRPDHPAAIRGARRTLARTGKHAALPGLFDAEIELTREPEARARLLYEKARLLEQDLRQSGGALAVYREALALDPGNLSILKAIERALRRDKAHEPLADVYAQLANSVQSGPLKAAWTAVRARLTETELKDPAQAAALYEAALEADPNATDALAHVKRLGATQQRWPQLVDALLTEHSLAEDEPARLAILLEIARIEEQRMGDADAAIETLGAAREAAPSEPQILRELARLHRDHGRHAEEIEALGALVDLLEDRDERARICHRIGHVHEQRLAAPDAARPWYERTLSIDPSHRAAGQALARLLEQAERYNELAKVWLERARSGVDSRSERAELFHQVGDLQERRLGDTVEATKLHVEALGLAPDHHGAFQALTRLYAAASRWPELVDLYERAIDRAPHDEEAIMWLFRVGAVREDRLNEPKGALATYERILQKDPNHLGALHAIVRAGALAGEHARVIAALQKEATLTKDSERAAALFHRAAMITAHDLDDADGAMRALEAILKKQPKHRASLESLAGLLSDAGRWKELVSVYARLLPLTSTAAEKVRLQFRMGEIQQTQIGDEAAAVAAYRQALALDPDFAPAREALLDSLRRSESWDDLVTALEQRVGKLRTPLERARACTEIGAILEDRVNDADRALAMYERALAEVPLHHPAIDARERLLASAERWSDLSDALADEVEAQKDPYLHLQRALRTALVKADQQGAVAPTLDAFRPVFEQQPEHVGALLAVETIYARNRDDAGLAATFEKMAQVIDDPRARLAALEEQARARAAAGGDVRGVLRKILELEPGHVSALTQLADRAVADGDASGALTMHTKLANVSSDPLIAAFHQTRVGELLLSAGRPTDALESFRAALALDATSLAAIRGMSRAALIAQDAAALRQAAQRERDVAKDRHVAVGLLLRAAAVHLMAERTDEAVVDYEAALAMAPQNERAAAGLRACLTRPDQAPQLIDLLSRAAHACDDPMRAAALHRVVGELHAGPRDDLPAAIAAVSRALESDPDSLDALGELAAYQERSGLWSDSVQTLERLIPKARDERLVDAHLRLARIAEAHIGDRERAMRSLRAVLSRDEDNERALGTLVRLERETGRHEEALRLAKKLMSVVKSEERKAFVLTELAVLERARGKDAAAAANAFSAVGTLGPSRRAAEVYKELIANAPEHATWDDYSTALMMFIERNEGVEGDALPATYRELAWVFTEAHNRPDRAIATLREGVTACPTDASISLALVKSLRDLSANDKALVELRRYLAIDAWNAKVWRALADLFRATGEPEGAAIALSPVLAMKQASEDEAKIVTGRTVRAAEAPPGILGRQGLSQIIDHGGLEESAATLVHALSDVFGKLEGFEPEQHGLTRRDRIKHGDAHPLRAFADRVGMTFGVPEYDLYVADDAELDWAVAYAGSPPALVVPARIEQARDPVLAFHLARPLAMMSRLLHPVDRIDPVTMERILVGAARQFEPDFALRPDDPDLERETRRVGKAIGFFTRSRIQDAATTFAAIPTRDVAGWVRNVRRMAARAALLVCDDLLAAYEALGTDTGAEDLVPDLARFWVSDPAMRFRRRVAQQI